MLFHRSRLKIEGFDCFGIDQSVPKHEPWRGLKTLFLWATVPQYNSNAYSPALNVANHHTGL